MTFPLALRGYARAQVDAHVAALEAQLQQAVQRAEQAEASLAAVRADAAAHVEQADAALAAAHREAVLRAEEAELALVAVHEAALATAAATASAAATATAAAAAAEPAARKSTQPIPLGTQLLRDETTVATLAPSGGERVAEPLPGPRRGTGRRSRLPLALGAALALLLAGGAALVVSRDDGPAPTAAAAPSADAEPSAAAGALAGSTAPQAARAAPAEPAQVPDGWTTVRSPDGLWTIGLPPGWRAQGDGYVSASGLTTMQVRTGRVQGVPDLRQYERAFAADHAGYERLAAQETTFRGYRAGTWDYVYGSGETQQRGSDLGVLAGDRGYWLHVVSRASAWEFAQPLVKGFRASFTPTP